VDSPEPAAPPGSAGEVFGVFLRLGLTSFGGPLAHVGYFQRELVLRRRWLDEAAFAQLLAVCQSLPGPASSQLGLALGWQRAGWRGAIAAFVAFTLPSAVLMFVLALQWPLLLQSSAGGAVLHGLKLLAVVVVAQAVWTLGRQLLTDRLRWLVAAAATAIVLVGATPGWQLMAIACGAVIGLYLPGAPAVPASTASLRWPRAIALPCALLFALGLALALATGGAATSAPHLGAAAWRAGSLVFGGGHVVLPLLEAPFVGNGWMTGERFLAGYGAAQAMPGPMFSVAAYLGASVPGVDPVAGAVVCLLGLFAPGFLLLGAALPAWQHWIAHPRRAGMIAGINAAAVGLLAAALYRPVWTQAIAGVADIAIVLVGLCMIGPLRRHPLWALAWCVLAASLLRRLAG